MKENRKGLVIAIIVLLVGAGVIPSISGDIETDRKETNGERGTAVIGNPISMDSIIGVEETVPRFDGNTTIVSIQPPAQTVEKGEWFDVGIYVEPSELIIGVYVDILHFDPTLIQADWVVKGDLFSRVYHFDPGTIDNINGSITDMCIVGDPVPVSHPGYFVNIMFIAQQKLGTSPLDIQDVGIADINGEPLPSTVIDGEVTVGEPPQITNVMLTTSDPLDTEPGFGWENVTCTVTDNVEIHDVKLVVTYPDEHTEYISMVNIHGTDTYYYNTTFTQVIWEWWGYPYWWRWMGNYVYYIWANDTNGNENTSASETFILPPNYEVDMNYVTRTIDFWDIVTVAGHYGENGSKGWIRADVDNDGDVDFWDIVTVAGHYMIFY